MAIHDSNPERRNLTVTSIAFIAFFYGNGSFVDTKVRLQVINAEFSSPEVLGLIAWVGLFWFIYRYWLAHNGEFTKAYSSEFRDWHKAGYIKKYAAKVLGEPLVNDADKEGYYVSGISWSRWKVTLRVVYARNIERDVYKNINAYTVGNERVIELSGLSGWFAAIRANLYCAVTRPSFSNYIIPYLLAITAISGWVVRSVF